MGGEGEVLFTVVGVLLRCRPARPQISETSRGEGLVLVSVEAGDPQDSPVGGGGTAVLKEGGYFRRRPTRS